MGSIPAIPSIRTCASDSENSGSRAPATLCGAVLTLVLTFFLGGCHHAPPVANTQQLDRSGMSYDSVQQLRALNVTPPEVAEIMKLHEAGFADATCVQAVQVFHNHGQAFRADDIIGLSQAGMSEQMIFALASLNDFGKNAGELGAMHLAGLSDAVVLEVARHRAEGKPVLSGASLAGLKNAGVRGSTLLELVRRGVPDSEANAIISSRRHGASDAQLLHHFTGS
jgi:hypothetical protein